MCVSHAPTPLGGGLRKAAPLYRRASLLGPQAALEAGFGGSWAVLGKYFGRYWVVLGALGMSWGSLGGRLGASWRRLGPSWRYLGASWPVLEASWGVKGGLQSCPAVGGGGYAGAPP